jgi:hypothetical protein
MPYGNGMAENTDKDSLDAAGSLAQAEQAGNMAATLANSSTRGAGRASLVFAIYLAIVVVLLGTIFRGSPGGFIATVATVPVVVSALIYSSRLRNPVLSLGVKRHLTRAGVLTGILGVVTAVLLDVPSGTSPLLWIPWGLVVGLPLAIAAIRILRNSVSQAHA